MKERRSVLDGPAWLVVWLAALLFLTQVATASPAAAQERRAEPELGAELYPPAAYPIDEGEGIVGIGNYDVGCRNDGFFGDVSCATIGTLTNLFFSLAKLIVAGAIWLLEAAAGFTLEESLTDTATSVADLLDRRVLGAMRLSHLGLVVSALYMGWQFLRGRFGLGAGEFALTLVVLGVLVHVSAGPGFGGAVTGAMRGAGGISAEVVALAADTDDGAEAAGRLGAGLVAGFVRDPYDTLNWGRPLQGTSCAAARNQALRTGPHGTAEEPRALLEAAGCGPEAAFQARATVGRLVGALLFLVVAVGALALLGLTALTLVVVKGMALFLIALLPVALYAGLFPGGGRSLLWHWVSALVRVLALVVALGVFLALLVAGLSGLLDLARGLWERFLLVVFFMAVMWVGQRQLVGISSRLADSTLHRLETAHLGGAHGAAWVRPYQAGGLTGLGVSRTVSESTADLPRAPDVPMPDVRGWVSRRSQERASA